MLDEFYELDVQENEVAILLMDYSALLLRTRKRCLAFDPAGLLEPDEMKCLDLLLYTHGHYDHFDKGFALKAFRKFNCPIIAESTVYRELRGEIPKLFEARPGSTIEVEGVKIHPISGLHVGPIVLYLLEVDGLKIFHGGDSAYVPLADHTADIAFLPTGEPSPTASPESALRMALDLKPRVVVPMHGSRSQHMALKERLENVEIVEKYRPMKIKV